MTSTHEAEDASPLEKRLSVPFTARDLEDLRLLRESPEKLRALPGSPPADASEARLARAVFEAGLERLRELEDLEGYAALAQDEDYQAYHRARSTASPRYSRG